VGGGEQDEQIKFVKKVPKPDQFSKRRQQEMIEKNKQP
jgi:hypothetical protein